MRTNSSGCGMTGLTHPPAMEALGLQIDATSLKGCLCTQCACSAKFFYIRKIFRYSCWVPYFHTLFLSLFPQNMTLLEQRPKRNASAAPLIYI